MVVHPKTQGRQSSITNKQLVVQKTKPGTTPTLKVDLRSSYPENLHFSHNSSVRSEA